MSEQTYNGWKNKDTWNAALWLQSDESYYFAMRDFMKDYKGKQPYVDFLESCGLDSQSTPDGVRYVSEAIDYEALNQMLFEVNE